jgi:hypothetical protein
MRSKRGEGAGDSQGVSPSGAISRGGSVMALCIACGRKATLSIYSRILSVEITVCRECALANKAVA